MRQIQSGDFIILQNDGLRAEISTPWSKAYRRTRFCHAAQIRRVEVNGTCFTQRERDQPTARSTDGAGLCCEYKCPKLEENVQVGEKWLKIGVGILTRLPERWKHVDSRQVDRLPTLVEACENAAAFTTTAGPVNGIAYREVRSVEVSSQTIHLQVRLMNTGEKTFEVDEYCHNFVSLGAYPIDETHHLFLPALQDVMAIEPDPLFVLRPAELRFTHKPDGAFFRPFQPAKAAQPTWTLMRDNSHLSISGSVSFTPDWITLWGDSYCVCPEVYQRICLEPGHEMEWERQWTFNT